jgi:hypothetical protein
MLLFGHDDSDASVSKNIQPTPDSYCSTAEGSKTEAPRKKMFDPKVGR